MKTNQIQKFAAKAKNSNRKHTFVFVGGFIDCLRQELFILVVNLEGAARGAVQLSCSNTL